MGKKLLITEKPSVAMEFAKALKINTTRKNGYLESEKWIITWCVGHLVTMSYPEKYNENLKFWRLDTLPFIPKEWKYEIIPAVENQFNIVKGLLQREDVEEIYNAGDSGREGEYIQRLVFMMAKPNPKAEIKRVWIDSQTEEEIKRGIEEAKDSSEYDSLSDSAYLRAKEDYLIGINFSRMLSIIYGRRLAKEINEERASISVGRVMTCVLGMIVEREREIRNFVKVPFYKIVGNFEKLSAEWKVSEGSKLWQSMKLYNETGFKKEIDAKEFIKSLEGKKAIVEEVKKSKQKENAPMLFNLAEIQNECTKRFKIKPDETLEIIQNLYEKKLVTYPRTDARVLSSAVAKVINKNLNGIAVGYKDEEIQGYIKQMKDENYSTNLLKTKYVNDSKITDHYAIIPTGQGYENYDKLPELQKQIYKLIVKRFLAIFYPPAEYSKVQVTVDVEGETFYASGKVCVNKGYLEIAKSSNKNVSKESTEDAQNVDKSEDANLEILKKLKKGQETLVKNYEIKEVKSKLAIRQINAEVYLKENGIETRNEQKVLEDGTIISYDPYKRNGKWRKVYVVEIIYLNRPFGQTRKYYIDSTTKEVVGGEDIYDLLKLGEPVSTEG